MEFEISTISLQDRYGQECMDTLLHKEGISRDRYIDHSVGIFSEGQLIAAGSAFHNVLKCIVVDSAYQGQGLTGHLVRALMSELLSKGMSHAFLYTRPEKTAMFTDLGFYPLVVLDKVAMLENRRRGFTDYLEELAEETEAAGYSLEPAIHKETAMHKETGAVVLNANPFTRGHLYLLEKASEACDCVHVFVVEEDVSLFSFKVREQLVREGSSHLNNLIFHRTADYIISEATFPSYFLGGEDDAVRAHAGIDCALFEKIANKLHITKRFVGEEPFSHVTALYNKEMKSKLRKAGIDCVEFRRFTQGNDSTPVSATAVREKYLAGDLNSLRELVPQTTFNYLSQRMEKSCTNQCEKERPSL